MNYNNNSKENNSNSNECSVFETVTNTNTNNANSTPNMQKRRRGRPRKNQNITNSDNTKKIKNSGAINATLKSNNNDKEEEIILHLPIFMKDFETHVTNSNRNNTTLKSNLQDNLKSDLQTGSTVNVCNNVPNVFTINDINSDNYSSSSEDTSDIVVHELKQKVREQETLIRNLENELNECRNQMNANMNFLNTRNVSKMNIELIKHDTGEQIIAEKTDIACWWCTHNFDTMPCFIPERYTCDKYYVFGCFCSINCASTYNLNMNDSDVWNRYSLLRKLYGITNDINLAPPRETFAKFGGNLTYNEYRENCIKYFKEYRFIMPPMSPITPLIEEGKTETTRVKISLSDLSKKKYFGRNKALPNVKSTLFDAFQITGTN